MWVLRRVKTTIKMRHAVRFWRPFLGENVAVVVAAFMTFEDFEPSGFIGLGDAMGFAELRTLFHDLGVRDLRAVNSTDLVGALRQNLIVIGGPNGNVAAAELFKALQPNFSFDYPPTGGVVITDRLSQDVFRPSQDTDSRSGQDFGIILRTENPLEPECRVIVVAGCYGFGTWGALQHLLADSLKSVHAAELRTPSYECVVRVRVAANAPQHTQVVRCRPLTRRR